MRQIDSWKRMRIWELRELCEDKGSAPSPGCSKQDLIDLLCRLSLGEIRGIESEIEWEPGEKKAKRAAYRAAQKEQRTRDEHTKRIAAEMGISPGNSDANALRARMALRAPLLWAYY